VWKRGPWLFNRVGLVIAIAFAAIVLSRGRRDLTNLWIPAVFLIITFVGTELALAIQLERQDSGSDEPDAQV